MVVQFSEKKVRYIQKMGDLLSSYTRLVFCNVDNVQSQQMHNIRRELRGKGEMLMGKNTLMRKVIKDRSESADATELDKQLYEKVVNEGSLVGNLGILFTNEEFDSVQTIIKNNRIQAPARVGSIAPLDVVIPAGNTGLEPGTTSFFQALQLNTKIVKGAVEIVTEKRVLTAGDKVDNSTAVLLQKLKVKPFFYGLQIHNIFDNGEVYGPDVLDLKEDFFTQTMQSCITKLTSLSLQTGITTSTSFPHVVVSGFKNLLSLSLATELSFEDYGAAELIENIRSGKMVAAAANVSATQNAPAESAPQEDNEEEEDEDMGLGLFD
ncbi:60S acidic ribosomal subunit protein [Perkinsela sp. CCAP 1560/4]|nr:60S acidic ribosomal subunit protein [Perkinsela sp. CCAP 1560/4]|eukprot:KNH05013.1 60S acidic ribosomal subunit protein [Perkinsela sp. CCAP 1560/4]